MGYTIWRPTAPLRKLDLIARNPDGTIIRFHHTKRPIVEFDCSNCERPDGAPAPKPVFIELRRPKNWRWLATLLRAKLLCANLRWEIYILPFRVRGWVRPKIRRLKSRYKIPNHVAKLKPIYTEPATSDSEWRGWGL